MNVQDRTLILIYCMIGMAIGTTTLAYGIDLSNFLMIFIGLIASGGISAMTFYCMVVDERESKAFRTESKIVKMRLI